MPALLIRILSSVFGMTALKWVAQKALMTTLVTTVLSVVLWNLACSLLQEGLTWGTAQLGAVSTVSGASPVVALTGLAAYFAGQFRIPECVTFVMGIVVARFMVRMIAGLIPGLSGLRG